MLYQAIIEYCKWEEFALQKLDTLLQGLNCNEDLVEVWLSFIYELHNFWKVVKYCTADNDIKSQEVLNLITEYIENKGHFDTKRYSYVKIYNGLFNKKDDNFVSKYIVKGAQDGLLQFESYDINIEKIEDYFVRCLDNIAIVYEYVKFIKCSVLEGVGLKMFIDFMNKNKCIMFTESIKSITGGNSSEEWDVSKCYKETIDFYNTKCGKIIHKSGIILNKESNSKLMDSIMNLLLEVDCFLTYGGDAAWFAKWVESGLTLKSKKDDIMGLAKVLHILSVAIHCDANSKMDKRLLESYHFFSGEFMAKYGGCEWGSENSSCRRRRLIVYDIVGSEGEKNFDMSDDLVTSAMAGVAMSALPVQEGGAITFEGIDYVRVSHNIPKINGGGNDMAGENHISKLFESIKALDKSDKILICASSKEHDVATALNNAIETVVVDDALKDRDIMLLHYTECTGFVVYSVEWMKIINVFPLNRYIYEKKNVNNISCNVNYLPKKKGSGCKILNIKVSKVESKIVKHVLFNRGTKNAKPPSTEIIVNEGVDKHLKKHKDLINYTKYVFKELKANETIKAILINTKLNNWWFNYYLDEKIEEDESSGDVCKE